MRRHVLWFVGTVVTATACLTGFLPAVAWAQTGPSATARADQAQVVAGARVRVTVSDGISAMDMVRLVDPGLPTTDLRWRDQTIGVFSGGRVIVDVPRPGRRLIGTATRSDDRGLLLRLHSTGEAVLVPRAAIALVEWPTGTSRWRHLGTGALVGAGLGAGFGLAAESGCDPHEGWCFGPAVAIGTGALGAGIGALVGVLIPPADRWGPEPPADSPDAASQIPAEPGVGAWRPALSRLSVSLRSGTALSGGPSRDLEQAMRQAGLDGGLGGCFIYCTDEPIRYPKTYRSLFEVGRPIGVDGAYAIRPHWDVVVGWQRTPIALTTGRSAASGRFLDVGYRLTTTDVLLSRRVGPWRLGAGPAWHRASTRTGAGAPDSHWRHESSGWGYVVETGVRLPTSTRVCQRRAKI